MAELDLENSSRSRVIHGSVTHQVGPSQNIGTNVNSLGSSTYVVRLGDTTLPESYHLTKMDNYGLWAYCMNFFLKRDSLFMWCLQAPSI